MRGLWEMVYVWLEVVYAWLVGDGLCIAGRDLCATSGRWFSNCYACWWEMVYVWLDMVWALTPRKTVKDKAANVEAGHIL